MLPRDYDTTSLIGSYKLLKGQSYMDSGQVIYDSIQQTYAVNPVVDPTSPRYDKTKSIQRLMYDQKYTLQISFPDGQMQSLSFTSQYDPLYTSLQIIRQDLQDLVDDLSDDEINFKIYQVSLMAQQLAGQAQQYILFGSAVGNIILQFQGISKYNMRNSIPYPTPFFVQQYVRYKTELELVYAKFVRLSVNSGMMEKDLGDFKVIRQIMLPRIQEVIAELKDDIEEWENQLRGGALGKPKRTLKSRQNTFNIPRTGKF